jgi:hypothetical protein
MPVANRRRRWLLPSLGAFLLFAIGVLLAYVSLRTASIPPVDDIQSMTVQYLVDSDMAAPPFEVPQSRWKDVFSAISPYSVDPRPTKWQVLGDITIRTKHEQNYLISLYYLSTDPVGAFSAGPTFEKRVYYRGGNSARLKETLKEIYAAATKKTISH